MHQNQQIRNCLQLLDWLRESVPASEVVLTTGFGMEGCALVDLCDRADLRIDIADIETGNLFAETRVLRSQLVGRYSRHRFSTWDPILSLEQQAAEYGPELWHRDPDLCCELRKVEPMRRGLSRYRVWLTAVRRGQSADRSRLSKVSWNGRFGILQVNPLLDWEREHIWNYVRENRVPHNPLHHQGYPSIGCRHCTRPAAEATSISDYSRAGRWAGWDKTECGLHSRQGGE